jgi:hypothetical protein
MAQPFVARSKSALIGSRIGLDALTLLFAGRALVVTALSVSLIPALQASVLRPVDALKTGGKSMTDSGLQTFSARTTLVTVQIALALILVIGAGLMSKSGSRLYATGIDVNPTIGLPSFPPRSCTCATARRGGPFAAFSRTRSRAGLVRLESARPRINH